MHEHTTKVKTAVLLYFRHVDFLFPSHWRMLSNTFQ